MKPPLVAIADDDASFANYLKTFLDGRGYQSRIYSHGEDLLAAAHLGELPDVVLLDVMMPGMDGLATLRSLKAAHPDLQVIMLSGRENAPTIVEALNLGAVNYVVKPDDPDGLGRDRARNGAQAGDREAAARVGSHRAAPSGERRSGAGVLLWRTSDAMRQHRGDRRSRGRQRRDRADSRRERRRQGAGGAGDSRSLGAAQPAVRQGQLRGAARRAAGERAVRPREGRVHRRGDVARSASSSTPTAAR